MNVLIAGGMGFVGLNIAEQVLLQGGRVTLFGPDSAPPAFIDVLKALPGHLEVVSGDVTRRDDLDSVLAGLKPEFVINAAAITAGPEREVNAAHDIFRVNLLGTLELLRHACGTQLNVSCNSAQVLFLAKRDSGPRRLTSNGVPFFQILSMALASLPLSALASAMPSDATSMSR